METNEEAQNKRILSDLFLNILENNSNAQQRVYINNIRAILNIPECAELFNVILVNALGVKLSISENTVRKDIDTLISYNKVDIDKSVNISTKEKEHRKLFMTKWIKSCEEILIALMHNEGLLK